MEHPNFQDRKWDLWYKFSRAAAVLEVGDQLDPATIAWQQAVTANGGTYNDTDTQAVNYFVVQTKAQGIWDLLDWVALMAGRDLNAALVPLKHAVGSATMTNNNFVGTDFSPTAGLMGNGTSKYLALGINGNQFAQNSVSQGVFWATLPSTGYIFGGGNSSGSIAILVNAVPAINVRSRNSSPATLGGLVSAGYAATARSSGTSYLYQTTAGNGSNAVASQSPANEVMNLFSREVPSSYSNATISSAFLGKGMTTQQLSSLVSVFLQTMIIMERPPYPYDIDAWTYLQRANITNSTDRQQINDWFIGLKNLGLYNSVTEMWSLRSNQNIGTGSTVNGMKLAFNATLVNGPTWSTNGITFAAASTQYATTTGLTQPTTSTQIACFTPAATAQTFGTPCGFLEGGLSISRDNAAAQFGMGVPGTSGPKAPQSVATSETVVISGSGTVGNTAVQTSNNGTSILGGTLDSYPGTGTQSFNMGRHRTIAGNWFDGRVSFTLVANKALSSGELSSVYSLYKTTIGQGLGLP